MSLARRLNLLLLLCAIWISRHPYFGIIHDARLYMIQTLARLDHARLAHDLYLAYGSQDSFSVFSALFAPLVAAVGPGEAHVIALIGGEALWFAALLFFVRALFPDHRTALWAAALVMLLQGSYSMDGLFIYAEPFVTPRLFAEALVLLALAFVLRDRLLTAGAILVIAAAIHPLMAAPGVAVLALAFARRDRRLWVLVAFGSIAVLGLAFLHVPPFDRIFLHMDGDWLRAVEVRDSAAFLTRWDTPSLLLLCIRAAFFPIFWQYATQRERAFLLPVAAVALLGLVASFIGSDVLHNVLLINLQLWRALWIAALVFNVMLAALVIRIPRQRLSRNLLLFAIFVEMVGATMRGVAPIGNPVLLLVLVVHRLEDNGKGHEARAGLIWAMAWVLAIAYLHLSLFGIWSIYNWHQLALMLCGRLVALCAAWLLWTSFDLPLRAERALAAAILLVLATVTVDQRNARNAFIEQKGVPADLRAFISNSGNTYWERGVDLLWFKLRRPSYLSALQGSGIMFHRRTSEEYIRRAKGLIVLHTHGLEPECASCGAGEQTSGFGPKRLSDIVQACKNLPDLNTIVVSKLVPGTHPRAWHAPVPLDFHDGSGASADTFYRYDCSAYR